MNISLNTKSPTEASISIQLQKADYASRIEEKLKTYSRQANIKGFRPGKVPHGLIKKMYGKPILIQETNALAIEALQNYIKEHALLLLGEPLPKRDKAQAVDWDNQTTFDFEYTIGLEENFVCKNLANIQVTNYHIDHVEDEAVDALVASLRKAYGTVKPVEESADKDLLFGTLTHLEKNFTIKQRGLYVDQVVAKERKQFIGIKPHTTIIFDIQKILAQAKDIAHFIDQPVEALSKFQGRFTFTVEKIQRMTHAAMDQDFFKFFFNKDTVQSEQTLREKLREKIKQRQQSEATVLLHKNIKEGLMKHIKINLPDDFLKKWLQKKNLAASQENIEKYYVSYAEILRWQLIVKKIAKDHDLKVSEEEILKAAKPRFSNTLRDPALLNAPEEKQKQLLYKFLHEHDSANYKAIYEDIMADKVITWVKQHITMHTQKLSAQAFEKLAATNKN